MNITKSLVLLLCVVLLVWAIQAAYLIHRNQSEPGRIKSQGAQFRHRAEIDKANKLRALEADFQAKEHLATGSNVFDRIFNTQDQSVLDLIRYTAREALPDGWSSDARVEEFTHFILLVYLPHNSERAPAHQLADYLEPITKYCGWCLSDVAVFDRTHKSYLFFDKGLLDEIKSGRGLSEASARRAEEQGAAFTRLNSVTIKCEKHESHLFLPIEVQGDRGIISAYALFDTGASITMISEEASSMTGAENLQTAPRRSFSTANGWMSCPVIRRGIGIGGYSRVIDVAVNQQDDLSLVGVNFFSGLDYIVDFQNSVIHVWEK